MFEFIEQERPGNNVTHTYVDSIEQQYNIRFPEILRTYYTEHNKSKMREIRYQIQGLSLCVDFIMPLANARRTVEHELEAIKDNQWIPQHLVPFAVDIDSNYYYWDKNTGHVYYLSMDSQKAPVYLFKSTEAFFAYLSARTNIRKEYDMNNYLPLGSIVLLKGGVQKVLIIARAINVRNGGKEFFFDYGGVPYPEGLVSDQMAYFNADKINKIIFEGYTDAEDDNMVDSIRDYLAEHPNLLRGDPATWNA